MAKKAAAATKMTQSQIVAALAEQSDVSKKVAKGFLENLAEMAVKQGNEAPTVSQQQQTADTSRRPVVERWLPQSQIIVKLGFERKKPTTRGSAQILFG